MKVKEVLILELKLCSTKVELAKMRIAYIENIQKLTPEQAHELEDGIMRTCERISEMEQEIKKLKKEWK